MSRRSTIVCATAVTALALSASAGAQSGQTGNTQAKAASGQQTYFQPPAPDAYPKGEFGKAVRRGHDLFVNTQQLRGKYVGNALNCSNCHLDAGRLANSAPMWAAYVAYPAYRSKNKKVNTMEERVQGCLRYSENGKPPPAGSPELTDMISYMYWLATGAPTNEKLAGKGYPRLKKAAQSPSPERGAKVYQANCAVCHGADGQGTKAAGGSYVFPPLWGPESYNWGAGMHSVSTAAGFIKYNMPFGKAVPNHSKTALSDQQAWDVAAFVNSHERPQDPRYAGNLEATAKKYHSGAEDYYGKKVNGKVLGANAYPNPLKQSASNTPPPSAKGR